MMNLTAAYCYYDQPKIMKKHLERWTSCSDAVKLKTNFLIVDDASPKHPAGEQVDEINLNLSIYRINENIPWNHNGAKNLAMEKANTDWALLLDMDLITDENFLHELHKVRLEDSNVIYKFNRDFEGGDGATRPHPSAILVNKLKYWQLGGLDEDFSGHYGYDDTYFDVIAEADDSTEIRTLTPIPHYWLDSTAVPSSVDLTSLILTQSEGAKANHENMTRNIRRNWKIYKKKKKHKKLPENPLRFSWKKVFESTFKN